VTADGGTAWAVHSDQFTGDGLPAVACPSTTVCFIVGNKVHNNAASGDRGVVISTSDGGALWSSVAVPPMTGDVSTVACPSITACDAAGEGLDDVGGLILTGSVSGTGAR
jgi:hypothetical protein